MLASKNQSSWDPSWALATSLRLTLTQLSTVLLPRCYKVTEGALLSLRVLDLLRQIQIPGELHVGGLRSFPQSGCSLHQIYGNRATEGHWRRRDTAKLMKALINLTTTHQPLHSRHKHETCCTEQTRNNNASIQLQTLMNLHMCQKSNSGGRADCTPSRLRAEFQCLWAFSGQ